MARGIYLIIIYLVLILAGCTGNASRPSPEGQGRTRRVQAADTLYTEKAALAVYGMYPERALVIIDSARIVGNLSDFRADLLRAIVFSRTYEGMQLDSAILIGERLMRQDSVMTDVSSKIEVLDVLLNACRLKKDNEQALHWATMLGDLYRQRGEQTEALRTDAEIGQFLVRIGQQEEGLAKIDSVILRLDGQRKFNELDASIIALKRKAEIVIEKGAGNLESSCLILPTAQRMLNLLSDYEQHPADYHDNSSREPSDAERPIYIDFYQGKAYAYMAAAYASIKENAQSKSEATTALQKARAFLALYEQTVAGRNNTGRFMIAPMLGKLGEYDRMVAIYDEMEWGDDTLTVNYAESLRGRAQAAAARGRHADAYNLMCRYSALTNQLNDSLLNGKAHLYAARFHAQEQQQEIEQQKAGRRMAVTVSIAVGILALILLAFALNVLSQWRKTQQKNRVLARQIKAVALLREQVEEMAQHPLASSERGGEAPSSVEQYGGDSQLPSHSKAPVHEEAGKVALDSLSPEELFRYISREIQRRLLFLNPSFDRQAIMDEFHISKDRVGAAFSQGSPYDSLPQFINELRLEYACNLIVTTDLPITEIMTKSGFSNASVFSRYFSRKFQLSPTQYRRANAEQTAG